MKLKLSLKLPLVLMLPKMSVLLKLLKIEMERKVRTKKINWCVSI